MALVSFSYFFIGDEFAPLRLCESLADCGARFVVERERRSVTEDGKKRTRKLILLIIREQPRLCDGLFQQLRHLILIANPPIQQK